MGDSDPKMRSGGKEKKEPDNVKLDIGAIRMDILLIIIPV